MRLDTLLDRLSHLSPLYGEYTVRIQSFGLTGSEDIGDSVRTYLFDPDRKVITIRSQAYLDFIDRNQSPC